MTQIAWYHVYFILKLTEIRIACIVTFSILAASLFLSWLIPLCADDIKYRAGRLHISGLILSALLVALSVMLPTTPQAAVAWAVPKVVNSDFVQGELTDDMRELYSAAKDWLKGQVNLQRVREDRDHRRKMKLIEKVLLGERISPEDQRY